MSAGEPDRPAMAARCRNPHAKAECPSEAPGFDGSLPGVGLRVPTRLSEHGPMPNVTASISGSCCRIAQRDHALAALRSPVGLDVRYVSDRSRRRCSADRPVRASRTGHPPRSLIAAETPAPSGSRRFGAIDNSTRQVGSDQVASFGTHARRRPAGGAADPHTVSAARRHRSPARGAHGHHPTAVSLGVGPRNPAAPAPACCLRRIHQK